MGLTIKGLIDRLKLCPKKAQVIFGPGYMGPDLTFYPQRFHRGCQLGFGNYSADHNAALRPKIVKQVKVGAFLKFLQSIPGTEMTGWKGDDYTFDENYPVLIGLPGEIGLAVTGIVEDDLGDGTITVQSAYQR